MSHTAHPPDVLLAKGAHEILHLGLGEMLVVIFHQLGIDGGHCHEHTDTGSFGAQELLPHLGRKRTHMDENTPLLSKISWQYSWKLLCAPHPYPEQVPNFHHAPVSQSTTFISHPTSGSPTHQHTHEMMEMAFFSPVMLQPRICSRRWTLVAESVHSLIMHSSSKAAQSHQCSKARELFLGKIHLIYNTRVGAHGLQPPRQSWEEGEHALELGVRLRENSEVQRAVFPASSEEPSEPTGKAVAAGDSRFSEGPLPQPHSSREECSMWE